MSTNDQKGQKAPDSIPPQILQRDPLDAVPVIPENVESRLDDRGVVYLRRSIPPKPGLQNWLSRKLGFHRARYFDLDPAGSFFWKQIDGKKDLHWIRRRLAAEFDFDEETSRAVIMEFTKMLMSRGVIGLAINHPDIPVPTDFPNHPQTSV